MEKIWTKDELRDQLRAFDFIKGHVVHVHSSLRAVGKTEGRGEGLLDVLIEQFTADGGLLTIPTHTWDGDGVDLTRADTCVGTLARLAAADPRGVRTSHPSHSMAVFGAPERVAAFIEQEATATTPAPPDGCYGKLAEEDGYVLLVGVGHNRNTFLHAVDEILGTPNRMDNRPIRTNLRRSSGQVIERELTLYFTDYIDDISYRFPKYETAFRYHKCIVDGFLGNAPTQLCDARKMKETVTLIFQNSGGADPLYGESPIPPAWYCSK